tara:strand:- start:1729 stop:2007 length:279 start_codon:yes stop_codon:yes gene_type:complete
MINSIKQTLEGGFMDETEALEIVLAIVDDSLSCISDEHLAYLLGELGVAFSDSTVEYAYKASTMVRAEFLWPTITKTKAPAAYSFRKGDGDD